MDSYMEDVYRKQAEEEHELLLLFVEAAEKFFNTDSWGDLVLALDKYRNMKKSYEKYK